MLTPEQKQEFCVLRRQAIALEYASLNPQQREAVLYTDGPLLLLAGAGSGKTTVLIHRVANLIRYGRGAESEEVSDEIEQNDLEFLRSYIKSPNELQKWRQEQLCAVEPATPWSIIAITFTNKAAGELKERLTKMLGADANNIWASTFHSACVRILRRDIERLGFNSAFTIYDTDDSLRVIRDIMRTLGMDDKQLPPKTVLGYISQAKDAMKLAVDFERESTGNFRMERIARIYTAYEKKLWESSALDFDDIILHTVRLLETENEVREYYQNKFRYVLIDEYQDTNKLQYRLAALLAGKRNNICVVGDDDQSIYRFRGATIENILSFEEQYAGAKVIRLEQNYRSTANILSAANAVIRNNQGRKGKELWTERGAGEKLQVYTAQNEHDEARYVLGQILNGLRDGKKEKDFAILYRNNTNANVVYQTLIRNGIAVHMKHPMTASAEIRDIMAYLYLVVNSDDDLRLKRIINVPARGIGERTVEIAEEIAEQRGKSIFTLLSEKALPEELGRASGKLRAFVQLIEDLREKAGAFDLPSFYEYLLAASGYLKALEEKKTPENQRRIDRLMEFKSIIQDYLQRSEENGVDPTLPGFLEEMALDEQLGEQDDEDNSREKKPKEERVQMMTMHGAKGLEFPVVFLIALEDGVFPGQRAIGEEAEMEEERRLCYVAMTRAKKTLHISSAASRMLYGRTTASRPSRFLNEVPPELVEKSGSGRVGWTDRREASFGWEWEESPGRSTYTSGGQQKQYDRSSYGSFAASNRIASSRTSAPPSRTSTSGYKPSVPTGYSGGSTFHKGGSALPEYQKGDMVRHKAFGRGMVLSIQKTGGDALIEIAFDDVGTKRLMLKFAAQQMTKET